MGRRLSLLPRVTSWRHRARVERVPAAHENHGTAVRGHFLGGAVVVATLQDNATVK